MLDIERKMLVSPAEKRGSAVVLVAVDEGKNGDVVEDLRRLGCPLAHLSREVDWFAGTPLRLHLHDGICVGSREVRPDALAKDRGSAEAGCSPRGLFGKCVQHSSNEDLPRSYNPG